MTRRPQDIYFKDHEPGCPSRISVGALGATIYGTDGKVVATLSGRVVHRIVQAWAERQPPAPYHFLGAEADKCA